MAPLGGLTHRTIDASGCLFQESSAVWAVPLCTRPVERLDSIEQVRSPAKGPITVLS